MAKEIKVTISVYTVPHPKPKEAIELIAKLVTKQLVDREEARRVS